MAQEQKQSNNNESTSSSGGVVIITGVSAGLGEAMVNEFISKGYTVFGCARRQSKIDELNKQYPNNKDTDLPYFKSVDLTNEDQLRKWAEEITSKYIPTLVLASAGYMAAKLPVEAYSKQNIDAMIDLNIKHTIYMAKYFLPCMKQEAAKNKDYKGAFFAWSSGAGRQAMPMTTVYCASKYAVEGFIAALAAEFDALKLSDQIIGVSYDPGVVATEMFRDVNKQESIDAMVNKGMMGTKQWAQISVPHILSVFANGKESNGKQETSPQMTDDKYKGQVGKAYEIFMGSS